VKIIRIESNIIKVISNFIFVENAPEKSDIIFIPGSVNSEPSEYAAKLWKEGISPYILPSGRFPKNIESFDDLVYKTEWEFLRSVLRRNGVDESKILKEDKATFTYQNALFSKEVTDSMGLTIKKAIICCKSYHSRRCLMYYQLVYKDTDFLVCPVDVKNVTKDNWHLSEYGIDEVLGELKRCGEQFDYIFKDIFL